MTEIIFHGQEFDGAEERLGNLSHKLNAVANDQARARFGDSAITDPSNIEVTPAAMGNPIFIVNTWHQTGSEQYPGVIQRQDFTLKLQGEGEDVYVYADDEERRYRLTTRETLLLMDLGNIALMRAMLDDSDRE